MLNLEVPANKIYMDSFILYIEIHAWYIHKYKLLGTMLRTLGLKIKKKSGCKRPLLIRALIYLILKFKII